MTRKPRTKEFRADGYLSSVLGKQGHRTNTAELRAVVEEAYLSRGLAATVVDRPAQDALSRGIHIQNDDDRKLADEFDRLRILSKLILGLKLALLHGAAAIIPIMDDSASLSLPMNLEAVTSIRDLRVVSGTRISSNGDIDQDPTSLNFGKSTTYTVSLAGANRSLIVHHTRVIPIPGEGAYMSTATETLPWQGRSVLASCWGEMRNYQDAARWAVLIMERKQQAVFKMKGLADLIENSDAEGDNSGELVVQRRISMVDTVRNSLRSVAVDAEDDFTVLDLTLVGIAEVCDTQATALAAAARIPKVVLFGEAPRGLGSSSQGEQDIYQSRLGHIRSDIAYPVLERLVELIVAQNTSEWPDDWVVEFKPLWEPSAKEQAETEKAQAEAKVQVITAITLLITAQLLDPEEGRRVIIKLYPEEDLSEQLPDFPELDPELDPTSPETGQEE